MIKNKIDSIFEKMTTLTDAQRYFCDDEIQESKKQFIIDMILNKKEHYIDFLNNQIEEIKPFNIHGCYDLELIREFEEVIKMIKTTDFCAGFVIGSNFNTKETFLYNNLTDRNIYFDSEKDAALYLYNNY